MELHQLVLEMKLLERRLTLYEEKYGILSKDFYNALMTGKLERFDDYDETCTDFSRWKGIYETWQRRHRMVEWEAVLELLETAEDLQIFRQSEAELIATSGDPEKAGWLRWDDIKNKLV